jgi:Tfp pilus assembly protein PilF
LIKEGKWNEVIVVYLEIIQKALKKSERWVSLAWIYQKVGHFSLAFNEYEKIVD